MRIGFFNESALEVDSLHDTLNFSIIILELEYYEQITRRMCQDKHFPIELNDTFFFYQIQ